MHDVDLVIVMGTSMKVAPVSEVPNIIPRDVPQIYISRDVSLPFFYPCGGQDPVLLTRQTQPVHHINFDINLLGDCDTVVAELCRRAGWDLRHDMIPKDQRVLVKSYNGQPNTFTVTTAGLPERVKAEATTVETVKIEAE